VNSEVIMTKQTLRKNRLIAAAAVALGLATAAVTGEAADRPVGIGLQGSFGSEADFGPGARLFVSLGRLLRGLEAVGSVGVFFPGDDQGVDLSYWEVNVDLTYRFEKPQRTVTPYVGAGVGMARTTASVEALGEELSAEETLGGINLLTGTQFSLKGIQLFTEARIEIGGGEQFVFTTGLRF
jgi:hypothetical protein